MLLLFATNVIITFLYLIIVCKMKKCNYLKIYSYKYFRVKTRKSLKNFLTIVTFIFIFWIITFFTIFITFFITIFREFF